MKRTVTLVVEEPTQKKGSKSKLHAYSFQSIAKVAGVSRKTVQRAVAQGKLKPDSLQGVLQWVLDRKVQGKMQGYE